MRVILYHHQKCRTSHAVLQILRESGIEPEIIEYLKTPLSRAQLDDLAKKLGCTTALLRSKEPLATELDLKNADHNQIVDAIAKHPILLNRPVVVTPQGAQICRPAESVRALIQAST